MHCSNFILHSSIVDEAKCKGDGDWVHELISILCDNTSAIKKSKNKVMHSRTKHIAIKYYFLREGYKKGGKIGVCWE